MKNAIRAIIIILTLCCLTLVLTSCGTKISNSSNMASSDSSEDGSSTEVSNSTDVSDTSEENDPNKINITQIALNREIIYTDKDIFNYSDTEYFYYNIFDPMINYIDVDVKTNCSDAEVTTSKNDLFQIGENDVTIKVTAPGKNPATIKVKVCRYDKEGYNAYWIYQNSINFYCMAVDDFKYNDKDVYTPKNENPGCAILNYNEVMAQNFTKNGIKQFEDTNKFFIYKHNGKVYGTDPSRGGDITYLGTILVKKSLTADTAVYTAKSIYFNGGYGIYHCIESQNFILKNQNGNWLIEDFTNPL